MRTEPASPEEFERRIRRISEMRVAIHEMQRRGIEEFKAGRIPYQPKVDLRSSPEFWRNFDKQGMTRETRGI